MLKITTIALLVLSFVYPSLFSWISVIFFAFLELYFFLLSKRVSNYAFNKNITLSEEERKIYKKYYLYFRYPFASRSFSTSLSLIGISSFIFVPWFLYNHLWIQGIFFIFNFFFAQKLSFKLNIRFYLHDYVETQKKEEYREEMLLVDSICNKILNK